MTKHSARLPGLFAMISVLTMQSGTSQPNESPTGSTTEALSAEDAKKALEGIRSAEREPGLGTWRKITFTPGKTNILYVRKSSENSIQRREEILTPSPTNSAQINRRVYVDNTEGSWMLIGNYAYSRDWPLEDKPDMKGWSGDKASGETLIKAMQMDLKDAQLVHEATVTGQRIKHDGAVRLHIVETYNDKAQRRVVELMAAPIKQIKKQVPFFLRPFFTTSVLTDWLTRDLPRRKELVIDDATGDVVERSLYKIDGTLLTGELSWAPCAALKEGEYAVPDSMKRMGLPIIANTPAETKKPGIMIEDEHSVVLKTDDVLLVSIPSGPTALLQFTAMDTNVAAYRWRCRTNKQSPFEAGDGILTRVVTLVQDSQGTSMELPQPGNDTTIRAGLIWLKWKPTKAGASEVYYEPKRVKIKKLNKEAFYKDPK